MFWRARSTLFADDEEWQLAAWAWLLGHLGGTERLRSLPTLFPRRQDFPHSGRPGLQNAEFVFGQVCSRLGLQAADFDLRRVKQRRLAGLLPPKEDGEEVPIAAAGTYEIANDRQIISYDEVLEHDLECMITVFTHELCHSILLSIDERPDGWGDNEEFMTDLAAAFMGFGIFGGNQSLRVRLSGNFSTGNQVETLDGIGYLRGNEWGFALAVRAHLTGEDIAPIKMHASRDLYAHFARNYKYLGRNSAKVASLIAA